MTFNQYIANPMGKNNAAFSQRNSAKAMYLEIYNNIILRENGSFHTELFFDKSSDEYYCYINIPSEKIIGFYYDVVIKFETKDNGRRTENYLYNYDVRFFSNDPAFIFTYLRVFHKYNLFIEELKSKANKKALEEDPVNRNMFQIPGYVKSFYLAYLYMKSHNLFNRSLYTTTGEKYNKDKLLSLIAYSDDKIEEREQIAKDEALAKKKQKQEQIKSKNNIIYGKQKLITKVNHSNNIGKAKKTKISKYIKKL